MKSTTFILSTLIVIQTLLAIDTRVTTATISTNSTQRKSQQPVTTLANKPNGRNDACKSVPPDQAPEQNWEMKKTFDFVDRGKSYKLVYSAHIDSTSLCLVEGKIATPIVFKKDVYSYVVSKVERVGAKLFTVQIHEGNGPDAPNTKYQLDLGQPQNPKIKVLKRWIMKY